MIIRYSLPLLSLILLNLSITACMPMNQRDLRWAACKELRSDMIFNGATSDTRRAEIANTVDAGDLRTYQCLDCDTVPSIGIKNNNLEAYDDSSY